MAEIIVLDGYTTNPGDLSWRGLEELGDVKVYDRTPAEKIIERGKNAQIILTNKTVLNQSIIEQLPNLKCICVLATGYNVVDILAAKEYGITVCNVKGYASRSAAQHVFALLLALTNKVALHNLSVQNGDWGNQEDFSYWKSPIVGLAGKTMGIYGYGQIGQKVGAIAQAFDMQVIANHKHPERDQQPNIEFVSFEEMMAQSDVVSLHAPLSKNNAGIINSSTLGLMKKSAFLINTGRGGLVNESDLKVALENKLIAGAAMDVISEEPPKNGNILIGVKNCIVTPHQAWATKDARATLLDATINNVKSFLNGSPTNVVS